MDFQSVGIGNFSVLARFFFRIEHVILNLGLALNTVYIIIVELLIGVLRSLFT